MGKSAKSKSSAKSKKLAVAKKAKPAAAPKAKVAKPSGLKAMMKAVQKVAREKLAPKQASKAAPKLKVEKSIKAPPVVAKVAAAPVPAEKAPRGKKGRAAPKPTSLIPASLSKAGANNPSFQLKLPEHSDEVCREVACEGLATTGGYCRLHYIKNWKKNKRKEVILKEGKLNQYIEELVAKYPDKYLEAIRQDLAIEKEFSKVVRDLELDEEVDEFEFEGENDEQIIDSIKRDFEDEGSGGGTGDF